MKSVFGLLLILCLCVGGCGSDEEAYREPVSLISASPPGSEMRANMAIIVTFDAPPRDVTVSVGTVKVVGNKAMISGPFTPGPLAITITWSDGRQALNYTVAPAAPH